MSLATTTEVQIFNSTLIKLGLPVIVTTDDNVNRARLCKEQYPKIRDKLLRSHFWNFAIKRAALVESATDPAWGFTNQFDLPADFLKHNAIEDESFNTIKFEGNKLLIDASSVNLKYVAQITDVAEFDATFVEALAWLLAADLAYPLVQSLSLKQDMENGAKNELKETKSYDAMEGTPEPVGADDWINSRVVSTLVDRKVSTP